MTKELFERMVEKSRSIIAERQFDPKSITLVSGGAPCTDHIAVRLYLEDDFEDLIVHISGLLPA